MNKDILVSIVVITYNSSTFVVETLDSIKEQTHNNTELIITDDASTDDTLEIVKHWILHNKKFFVNIKIVDSVINTGITSNLNRGLKVSTGFFVKPIAGDDLLFNTCIEHSLDYCISNRCEVVYSKASIFTDPVDLKIQNKINLYDELSYRIFKYGASRQNKILHTGFPMYTTGLFFSKKLIKKMGYFDERYTMLDDYPFAFKLTDMGYKLNLLNSREVKYRVRTNSNSKEFKNSKRKTNHNNDLFTFQNDVLIPSMKRKKMWIQLMDFHISRMSQSIKDRFDNKLLKIIGGIIGYFSILKIKTRIKMIILYLKNKISDKER